MSLYVRKGNPAFIVEALDVARIIALAAHGRSALPDWLRRAYDDPEPGNSLIFTPSSVCVTYKYRMVIAHLADFVVFEFPEFLTVYRRDEFLNAYEPFKPQTGLPDASHRPE